MLGLKLVLLCSVVAAVVAGVCPSLQQEGACAGSDTYKVFGNVTAETCCLACAMDRSKCLAWNLDLSSTCFLQSSSVTVTAATQCAVSGQFAPPPTPPPSPAPRPHVVFLLADDLGHYDVAWTGNTNNSDVTETMTSLAKDGIILNRHYVHWHCSPTRRSLLTGRLPIHHSEFLSAIDSDDIDLRWQTIAHKLGSVGYKNYWVGKGHTGYMSVNHLPSQLGFHNFTGFLAGAQSYTSDDRWQDERPLNTSEYSANLYGQRAVQIITNHNPSVPMFMYLPWQNVHAPYTAPPGWKEKDILRGMLHVVDTWIAKIVAELQAKGMWNNTLIIFSADNGGVDKGLNWPMRGEKHTNWDGGMRACAFLAGGFVPERLRGTSNHIMFHVVDWYPTLANLAGVSGRDDPPVPPLPVDPTDPTKDIYGQDSFPSVDGVDIWPMVLHPEKFQNDSAHAKIWLSTEVFLMQARYKIVVAQPEPDKMDADFANCGWKGKDEVWVQPTAEQCRCGCAYKNRTNFIPCLFDLQEDPNEYNDISQEQPALLAQIWNELNLTNLESYGRNRTPAVLLGKCDPACAQKVYGNDNHPICGVPGC